MDTLVKQTTCVELLSAMYSSQCYISKTEKEHHEHKCIMMSPVPFRSTDYDYPFGNFKLFLFMTHRLPVVLAIVNVFIFIFLFFGIVGCK